MNKSTDAKMIQIDGVDYDTAKLSHEAIAQIANIKFCDEMILARSNEWAIADTARIGYLTALKNAG